jgi:septal ring factor EnvC (AmiA/AmiB activator)
MNHEKSHTAQAPEKRGPAIAAISVLVVGFVLAVLVIVLGVKLVRLNSKYADQTKQLTDAKAEAAKAEASQQQNAAATAQLQSQIDDGKKQVADMQAQVDRSKVAVTQAQAQLDNEKGQFSDMQSQRDKANAQSADFESQLKQTNTEMLQMNTQLDQAKIQSMDLQSRLGKAESDIAELQPLLLRARHMPVTTSVDKSHGDHFAVHVNNLYLQPLSVNITISGGQDKGRTQSNVIGAGGTLKVDNVAPGASVVIASDGYDPVTVTPQ